MSHAVSSSRILAAITVAGALLLSLANCAGLAAPIVAAGMETASYVNTEKFALDHVLSIVSGKECSAGNVPDGESYCLDDPVQAAAPVHYCYRTLGAITCYTEPDPYGDGAQLVE